MPRFALSLASKRLSANGFASTPPADRLSLFLGRRRVLTSTKFGTYHWKRLRGGPPIQLPGYPIHMVHAEKIVTAIQRDVANTRWRDFGDIWTLSRQHSIVGTDLQQAIHAVAQHLGAGAVPLDDVLDGYAEIAQAKWAAWRRRNQSDHLPEQFRSSSLTSAVCRTNLCERRRRRSVLGFWPPIVNKVPMHRT